MPAIKLLYGFVCEDVRQEINGKMTYVGQAEVFLVPQLPVVFTKVCVVYSVTGDKGKYQVDFSIKEKNGSQVIIKIPSHDVELMSDDHKIREVIQLNGMKIEKEGNYQVEIRYNSIIIHEFYFTVSIVKTAANMPGERSEGSFTLPIIMSSKN